MSVIFRFVLGVAAVWALEAAAQDYSSERASPGFESYDSYVADPAESYVSEGDTPVVADAPKVVADAPKAETPVAALEQRQPQYQPRQYDRPSYDQPPYAQPSYDQRRYDPAPYCRAYFPIGPGRDRSGTLCEQSDGSLRIVEAPLIEASPRTVSAAASLQYCREYQQDAATGVAYGKACWQRDGSWQIVSAALGVPGRDYPRIYAAVAPEARVYNAGPEARTYTGAPEPRVTAPARSYNPRPVERRFKMPEFYFGNLFGWLTPRNGRY